MDDWPQRGEKCEHGQKESMPSGVDINETLKRRIIKLRISDPTLSVDQIGKLVKLHRNTVGPILAEWYRTTEAQSMAADFMPEVAAGIEADMKNPDPLVRYRTQRLILQILRVLQPSKILNQETNVTQNIQTGNVAVHFDGGEHGERAGSLRENLRGFCASTSRF